MLQICVSCLKKITAVDKDAFQLAADILLLLIVFQNMINFNSAYGRGCSSCITAAQEEGLMQLKNNPWRTVMPHFQPHICCRSAHSWTGMGEDGDEEIDRREEEEEATVNLLLLATTSRPWFYHQSGWRAKSHSKADNLAPSWALTMPLTPAFVSALVSLAGKTSLSLLSFQLIFLESRQQELCRESAKAVK